MESVKNDKELCEKIIECINNIENVYTGLQDLENDILVNNTIMFQFLLIGDYAVRISNEYKNNKNNIDWSKIKGLRNIVVHDYDRVRYDVIDDTIKNDLTELKKEILK